MPNKTIYLNTIKDLEENVGFSLVNGEEVAQKLQEAWQKDTTQAKVNYLAAYREVFRDVLNKWSDGEFLHALRQRSEAMPNLKNCLLKTDEALKVCAMSLIPELRENADVLSNMTFGVMNAATLKTNFIVTRRKYLGFKEIEKIQKQRQEEAYNKYQKEWENKSTNAIAALAWDEEALRLMPQEEKINYALALEVYRNDTSKHWIDENGKKRIDDALSTWKVELGFNKDVSISESVVGQYFEYVQKIQEDAWIDREIGAAVTEFNAMPNPAQEEIAKYKELETTTAELKRMSEQVVRDEGVTEEAAEAFGEFFTAEEEARIALERKREKEHTIRNEGVTEEAAEEVGEFFTAEEEAVRIALERKKEKEHTIRNEGVTDEAAEMVGAFFMQEDLTQEIAEAPLRKEREFLQEKAKDFNKEYSLKVNHHKLRTSAEELSALMVKAQEEKQRFLSKNSIVVIENGKETCYEAQEYFKDDIEKIKQEYEKEAAKIEKERKEAENQYNKVLESITKNQAMFAEPDDNLKQKGQALSGKEINDDLIQKTKEILDQANARLDKKLAEAKLELEDELSAFGGGVVFEKNGKDVRRYKASRYYETHETQKEQNVYGEYQMMFSRLYKDACKNIKEQNYAKGEVTDFSTIAKDVDDLCKAAMYMSNVYDNEKNIEIIQKCSFGGLSAEQLASYATTIDEDSWAMEQSNEKVWSKQAANAHKVLAQWEQDAKNNKKVKPCDRVKETLEKNLQEFNKGKLSRKGMLDYMLAADSHMQTNFPGRASRLFSFRQYNREKKALQECRKALGLTEYDSLRVAMNNEYTKLSKQMSKEQIFKSIEKEMGHSLSFKEEKLVFEKEHEIVRDREVAKKVEALEHIKASGKVPMSIPELDERKAILNQEPRVAPISNTTQIQHNLSRK